MNHDTIAERYAEALLDLGVETSSLPTLAEEVHRMADAYAVSAEWQTVVNNPLIGEVDRLAVIDDMAGRLGLSRIARNAMALLAQRRRMAILPAIAKQLDRLANERAGIVRATVLSAQPLSEAFCQRLQRELSELAGKNVVLERKHDPALLAGVVVRLGDRLIDGSARSRLQELRSQLLSV